jgi:hypothetical protein
MPDSKSTSASGGTFIGSDDLPKVPFVHNGISSRFVKENLVVPLEQKGNTLTVAMADPDDFETIDALRVATSADIIVYPSDRETLN